MPVSSASRDVEDGLRAARPEEGFRNRDVGVAGAIPDACRHGPQAIADTHGLPIPVGGENVDLSPLEAAPHVISLVRPTTFPAWGVCQNPEG